MAKVDISIPGERIVESFTALVPQVTTPSTARAPDVGLVELSHVNPTVLVPGPPGPPGPRGSRWTTGVGDPTVITGNALGDMYLDDVTGAIWTWNGVAWINTGTDLSPDASELLLKIKTVDGSGSGLDADTLDGMDSTAFATDAELAALATSVGNTYTKAEADGKFVDVAGDTMTGNLTIAPPTGGSILYLNRAAGAGGFRYVESQTAGVPRWRLTLGNSGPEAGSDAGCNFELTRFNDAGGVPAVPHVLTANRATGIVDMPLGATTLTPAPGDNDTSVATTAFVTTALSSIVGGALISDTAPAGPKAGQLWFESDTGNTYIWVDDGDSQQWVQQNVMPPSTGITQSDADTRYVNVAGDTMTGALTVNSSIATTGANSITANAYVYSNTGRFLSTTATWIGAPASAGTIYLRPNGPDDGTGATTISSAGAMTVGGAITTATGSGITTGTNGNIFTGGAGNVYSGGGYFIGNTNNVLLCTTGAANIYLRPNGSGSSVGQTSINSAGDMTTGGAAHVTAAASSTGVVNGISFSGGAIQTSRTVGTLATHHTFYNTNGAVGTIQTNASATAYNTTSDERLKDVKGSYDPAEAIAIIRADPVRAFTWKSTGEDAVGWVAQRSYEVDHDLASPPELTADGKEDAEARWGIDYGRRTPYLWAALTNALDRIEQLEAKLALIEGGKPSGV